MKTLFLSLSREGIAARSELNLEMPVWGIAKTTQHCIASALGPVPQPLCGLCTAQPQQILASQPCRQRKLHLWLLQGSSAVVR